MPRPVKVVHIVPSTFGEGGTLGGAERYALELARYMADVVPTTLVSFAQKAREEKLGALNVRVLGKPWRVRGQQFNPFKLSLIREVLRADIVHCHQQHIVASSISAMVCRLTGRKVFVSDLGGGGWDISAYISTDRWYHGHLHISQYSRKIFGHEGKPWAHVIYGGIDTEKFSPDPTVPVENNVLFVGRLMPHKGVNDLVNAVPPDMPLELVGQPYHEQFYADLQKLAEGKHITFRHDFTDEALVHAYRKCLCIVLPSVYKGLYGGESKVPELLGQTLLEGMACGKPAICTDVASMPEVVEDGVTGFVVPPNNPEKLREKLLWMRDHPMEAGQMGQAARLRVLDKFNWPAVVQKCLKIYGLVDSLG